MTTVTFLKSLRVKKMRKPTNISDPGILNENNFSLETLELQWSYLF